MRRRGRVLDAAGVLGVIAAAAAAVATAQTRGATTPAPGRSPRYCNPLSIEASAPDGSPQGVNLGDVTVVREGGKYYLFGTGGGGWVSDDLVSWTYRGVEMRQGRVPVAPHVVKYEGRFYMSGNDAPLYRAPAILGPYELVGDWTDASGKPFAGIANGREWKGAFDVDIFVDDDGKPYLYFPARSTEGIDAVPLDPQHLNRFLAPPRRLFGFDRSHVWERYGEMNEYPDVSWIEGPWMLKRKGTYYLEYSASGTQWLTYATGVYTGKGPTGPFAYAALNPVLRKTTGVVTGTAHGSVVEGPDGNLWQFYTIVLSNPPGGRRIGMDPVGFDARGNLFVPGPSETPRWGPGVVADPVHHGDSGSLPLTVGKMRAMNTKSAFSSERPGHEAAYAVDNSTGTWWEPAEDDREPSITVDLGPATEFDPVQTFTVDSSRILFVTGRFFPRPGTPPPPPPTGVPAHRYRIEASNDGKTFTTVLDKTQNAVTKYVEFDELPPTPCRFVRLTLTDWPHRAGTPLGVLEFTVFGKGVSPSAPPVRSAGKRESIGHGPAFPASANE
jgi:xylan 1,4-beta-xylosidase